MSAVIGFSRTRARGPHHKEEIYEDVHAPGVGLACRAGGGHVAACGSSSSSSLELGGIGSSTPGVPLKAGENPTGQQLTGKKRGGTLTAYSSEDFEHLDPGESYFVLDYAVDQATQRPLFSYMPNQNQTRQPRPGDGDPDHPERRHHRRRQDRHRAHPARACSSARRSTAR